MHFANRISSGLLNLGNLIQSTFHSVEASVSQKNYGGPRCMQAPPNTNPAPSAQNVCVNCGKSYRQWGNLRRHQRYECAIVRPKFVYIPGDTIMQEETHTFYIVHETPSKVILVNQDLQKTNVHRSQPECAMTDKKKKSGFECSGCAVVWIEEENFDTEDVGDFESDFSSIDLTGTVQIEDGQGKKTNGKGKLSTCSHCGKSYKRHSNLNRHQRFECVAFVGGPRFSSHGLVGDPLGMNDPRDPLDVSEHDIIDLGDDDDVTAPDPLAIKDTTRSGSSRPLRSRNKKKKYPERQRSQNGYRCFRCNRLYTPFILADISEDDLGLVDFEDHNTIVCDPLATRENIQQDAESSSGDKKKSGHDGEEWQPGYKCFRCNRVYSWKNTLIRHQLYHCGVPPRFQCGECPYRARRKAHMKRHLSRWHENGKMFEYLYNPEKE
ncbi:hypothetical protein QAD02_022624 [Eretmocerus hayati]|uniref:Uncharacterized protein n=1 Tax=Eretmocerus hayati TaxID=131215 RepID=A0ACC2PTA6_9HYME|nr:hypothetical protein QAD02_022624 [Eretmocerus hayati]